MVSRIERDFFIRFELIIAKTTQMGSMTITKISFEDEFQLIKIERAQNTDIEFFYKEQNISIRKGYFPCKGFIHE